MNFLFRCVFFICATSSTMLFGNYWTPTAQLNPEGTPSQNANVSVDRFGVSVAVWEEKALPTSIIRGSVLPVGATTWIPTGNLSAAGALDRAFPQVRHDEKGNAIAIWLEQDGNDFVVRSSRLSRGTYDWISLGDVSGATPQSKEQHQLAVNGLGKAVAVWIESSEGVNKLFGSKKDADAASWVAAPLPISYPTFNATTPAIAMDGQGTAVTIWRNFKQGSNVLSGALLPHNSDVWTGTGVLGSKETPQSPHIAMNAAGKAVAVWAEGQSQKIKVKAATLTVGGTSWVYTTDVSAALPLAQQTPKVAVDDKGNAIASYIGVNGAKQVLKAALLPQSTAIWVRTNDASSAADKIIPEAIHLNGDGNASSIYQAVQKDVYNLKGSTKAKNSQVWIPANDLSKIGTQALTVSASFNASGTGIAVFGKGPTIEGSVHFGVFPPSDFSGQQEGEKIVIKRTWFNRLTWSAPTIGSPPAFYRIYSDAALTQQIAAVPGTQLTFVHGNRKNEAYTYYIISEDAFGGRSSAVSTTVDPYKKPPRAKPFPI